MDQKTYFAKADRSAQNVGVTSLSRPRWPFWGPLAAILDFAGGVALQVVNECPRHHLLVFLHCGSCVGQDPYRDSRSALPKNKIKKILSARTPAGSYFQETLYYIVQPARWGIYINTRIIYLIE